jgi:hypothetical protein
VEKMSVGKAVSKTIEVALALCATGGFLNMDCCHFQALSIVM